MAGLMAAVAILMIFSLLAVQEWADVLRRDNEAEMIFRAQDIVRAIQRYRHDNAGQPPMNLEDLTRPGPKGQYFIRRLYRDPLVADGVWGLLYLGPGGTIIDPTAEPLPEEGGAGAWPERPRLPRRSGDEPSKRPKKRPRPSALHAAQAIAGGQAGGLPIVGVKTLSDDPPFREYKGLGDYGQWLFTYFDLEQAQGTGKPKPRAKQSGSNKPGTGK